MLKSGVHVKEETTKAQNHDASDVVKLIKGWVVPFIMLFFMLALCAYLTLMRLFKPLTWAILLAFISYPAYTSLLRRFGGRHKNVAAMLMTLLVVVLLVVPTISAGVIASREAIGLFGRIADMVGPIDPDRGFSIASILPDTMTKWLWPVFERYPMLRNGTQQLLSWMASTALELSRDFLGNTVRILYHFVIIFIAFFFLLRDGDLILSYTKDIMPLMSDDSDEFMERAGVVLRAVVFGVIVTAGVQGVLGAIGWWFVGLSNPLLAGSMMALLAMIPFVGTPSIWIPGAIYLVSVNDIKGAAILFLWGVCVVSAVDNFMRPYFISEKARISTLLVFLGAFGGLGAWGFIGLFMGPLILSLFVFFLDSYRKLWRIYRESSR